MPKKKTKKKVHHKKHKKEHFHFWIATIIVCVVIILAIVIMINQPTTKVAATVNKDIVLVDDVNKQYDLVPDQYKEFITKDAILEQLIEETLLLQEAEKQGITVTDAEVDEAVNEAIQTTGMTKEQIVKKSLELNVPLQYTWSCYKNENKACGVCDSCRLRLKGFELAGVKDKIEYE